MKIMNKYCENKIAYINLSQNEIRTEKISHDLRKKFIGGAGINTKLFYDNIKPDIDPLSKENVLIFGIGLLTGTGVFAANRCTITTKSPLTGIFGDSNVGGNFAVKLKVVGYDHLVISGAAEKPVYIFIDEKEGITIHDAQDLWGLGTDELNSRIIKKHGDDCDIACIGQAGESLVHFASIIVSKTHAAGRIGTGCVMGSKRLKAIVVKSKKQKAPVFDTDLLKKEQKILNELCKKSFTAKLFGEYGTLILVNVYHKLKTLLHYNAQKIRDKKLKNLSPELFKKKYQVTKKGCKACPVSCIKKYEIKDGIYSGEKGEKLDYGTLACLGPNLGIYSYDTILHLEHMANNYGMDTMELGIVISLATECFQRGIITADDTGGLELQWNDATVYEKLITMIAQREKFGNILADGARRAGKSLNTERYTFTIKGVGVGPLSNKRKAWSLGYITSTRGGDHLKNYPFTMMYEPASKFIAKKIFKTAKARKMDSPWEKGRIVWWHENYKYVADSLGFCIFALATIAMLGYPFYSWFVKIIRIACGIEMSEQEILCAAESIYQLQKAFNVENGLTGEDDRWPVRKQDNNIDKYIVNDSQIDKNHEGMLKEYYLFRGHSPDGFPTRKRLEELGLKDVSQRLKKYVKSDDVPAMGDLLTDINLNVRFKKIEKSVLFTINSLLLKLWKIKERK